MARKKKSVLTINIEYIIVLFLMKLLSLLPYKIASDIGGFLGIAGYHLDKRHRNITLQNLRMAFPDIDNNREVILAKNTFHNMGRSTAEIIHVASKGATTVNNSIHNWVTVEGKGHLDKAIKKGKGVIYLSAHFGNWELMSLTIGTNDCPYNVIVRPLDNPKLDRLLTVMRSITGAKIMPKKNVLLDVLKRLKRGEALAILIDQNTSRELGVFVNFFSTPAATNKGPAIIAMKSGAAVIPTLMVREGRYRHRLIYGEELVLHKTGNLEKDIFLNTELFTNNLESYIRKYPDQWFWMHRRWKTRPE